LALARRAAVARGAHARSLARRRARSGALLAPGRARRRVARDRAALWGGRSPTPTNLAPGDGKRRPRLSPKHPAEAGRTPPASLAGGPARPRRYSHRSQLPERARRDLFRGRGFLLACRPARQAPVPARGFAVGLARVPRRALSL